MIDFAEQTIMLDLESWDNIFQREQNPIIISNPNALTKVSATEIERTREGIYDPRYGVDINENEDSSNVYRCDFGCTRSISHEGMICEECGTRVRASESLITTRGWIRIVGEHKLLTPTAWKMCKEYFGKHFAHITKLDMGSCVTEDGVFVSPEVTSKNKYYGIGYWELQKNFEEIVDYYYMFLYGKTMTYIQKINKNLLKLFYKQKKLYMSNISVITPLLREALIIPTNKVPTLKADKKTGTFIREQVKPTVKVEALNGVYAELVANSCEYNKNILEGPAFAYEVFVAMQDALIDIPNYIYKNGVLGGKEGYMNAAIHGGTMNFSGRAVITPLKTAGDADEIEIPWRLFLTISKYEIIRCITIIANVDVMQASDLWLKGYEYGTNDLMEKALVMLKSESVDNEFYVLLNRPPTLLVESIQLMRIRHIDRDLNEKTTRLSHMVLGKFSGDHDGDALTLFSPKTRNQIEVFKKLSPVNMTIDKISGYFDASVAPEGALGALLGQYNDPDSVEHLEV